MTCGKCIYCVKLKHNFEKGSGFEISSCCIYFSKIKDGLVIEVNPDNSYCELEKEVDNGDV